MRRNLVTAIAGVALVAVAAVCVPQDAKAQQSGGTLNDILPVDPPSLNIGLNYHAYTVYVGTKIYQSLLSWDLDNNPGPKLAESWDISDDGLTYTFHLRQDVTWHDGEPFTSADVVFTANEILAVTHPIARQVFANVDAVSAPDDYTVAFQLKGPYAPFLNLFTAANAPIFPAHIFEGTEMATNPANAAPIGTGPFKFAEWERGNYIRLVKNEDYYEEGLPHLDEVVFLILPDAEQRAIALETGRVLLGNGFAIPENQLDRLRATGRFENAPNALGGISPIISIEYNLRRPPMDDVRFRQALMHMVDREFIRDSIFFGLGNPVDGPMGPGGAYYDPDALQTYEFSIEKAEALLDDMGLTPDANGVRANIHFVMLPGAAGPFLRTVEYLKQVWAQAGVIADLEANDAAAYSQKAGNWEFDLLHDGSWQGPDPSMGVAMSRLHSKNILQGVPFTNVMGYSNPRVDEIIDTAPTVLDDDERQALYSEYQRIISEDVPFIPLFERVFPTLIDSRVHDLLVSHYGLNDDFARAWLEQ